MDLGGLWPSLAITLCNLTTGAAQWARRPHHPPPLGGPFYSFRECSLFLSWLLGVVPSLRAKVAPWNVPNLQQACLLPVDSGNQLVA